MYRSFDLTTHALTSQLEQISVKDDISGLSQLLRQLLWASYRRTWLSRPLATNYGSHLSFNVDTVQRGATHVQTSHYNRTVYTVEPGQMLQAYHNGAPHVPMTQGGNPVAFSIVGGPLGVRIDRPGVLSGFDDGIHLDMLTPTAIPSLRDKTLYICFLAGPGGAGWSTMCTHSHLGQLQLNSGQGGARVNDGATEVVSVPGSAALVPDMPVVLSYSVSHDATNNTREISLACRTQPYDFQYVTANPTGTGPSVPSEFSIKGNGGYQFVSLHVFDGVHDLYRQEMVSLRLSEAAVATLYI